MYKKLFAIALSLILVMSMGSFAILAEETEATPLADFTVGFDTEAELEGWSASGRGESIVIDRTVTDAPEGLDFGDGTLKFEALSEHANGLGRNKTITGLEPGATYVFSAWAKTETGGGATIGMGEWSTVSQSAYLAVDSFTAANTWGKLICTYTVPSDGSVTSTCLILRHPVGTSAVWYDDVRFYKDTASNPIQVENGFEGVHFTDRPKSSTDATTEKVLIPRGWTIGGGLSYSDASGAYAVASSDTAHSGSYSLKMKSTNNTATMRVYKSIPKLEKDATYMVQAFVKIVGSTSEQYGGATIAVSTNPTASFGYAWSNGGTETIKTKTADTASTGVWVPMRTFFTCANETSTPNIILTVIGGTDDYIVYFDDISVQKVDAATVSVVDTTGNILSEITNKTVAVNAKILFSAGHGSMETAPSCKLMYVLYDSTGAAKQISALTIEEKTLPLATQYSHATYGTYVKAGYLRESIDIEIPAGHSLKVFVFDNIGTLSPLSFAAVE